MPPLDDEQLLTIFLRLGVAVLGGLAVGIERELSAKAAGEGTRFAGVRTFLLLGLAGGLGAVLHEGGVVSMAALVVGAVSALIVTSYAVRSVRGDREGTTEVAAIVVVAGGLLAGFGYLPLASGVFALTWLVLAEKGRIHSVVFRIQPEVLQAAARFAVLALVVLPLLPADRYGPDPGFRPRELWIFVLLFSGVSFVGYLALLRFGPERGYGLAGLFGGVVSSTAVTLSFSRESRANSGSGRALALGLIAANTVVFVRVVAIASILNTSLGLQTAVYYAPPFVAGLILTLVLLLRSSASSADLQDTKNPLRLGAAVQMAILFQVFLYLVEWARSQFGESGVLASAGLLGLTDMDALTYSMVKYAGGDDAVALGAKALAIGMLSNTVVKLVIVVTIGKGSYRSAGAVALAVIAVVGGASILLV